MTWLPHSGLFFGEELAADLLIWYSLVAVNQAPLIHR